MTQRLFTMLFLALGCMLIWNTGKAQDTSRKVISTDESVIIRNRVNDTVTKIIITEDKLIINSRIGKIPTIKTDKRIYDTENITSDIIHNLNSEMGLSLELRDGKIYALGENGDTSVSIDVDNNIIEPDDSDKVDYDIAYADSDTDEDEEGDDLDNVTTRWFLLRLGMNTFIKDDVPKLANNVDPTALKMWPSLNWGFDLFQMRFNLVKHYLNLKTGIGFDFNYYEFENNVSLIDQAPSVQWQVENVIAYDKNNLYAGYLRVPFMLNLETNPYNKSRSFRINAGVYGALRLSSRLKQEWANRALKVKDGFNLTDWTYGLTGSIGYGAFNIYFNYSLVGLFKEDIDNGYALTPVNIGIELIPF